MDALELLRTRASNSKLTDPAPDEGALATIFEAALRAPDHQSLRPWRIHTVKGDARLRLGDVFAEGLRRRRPDASDEEIAATKKKPLRAPLLIVVSAVIREHPKVPRIEQVLAAGALAQNILLGLHSFGYAGMWRTGEFAYDPYVKQALGLGPTDEIVGFLYAGTPAVTKPDAPRPKVSEFVEEWFGVAEDYVHRTG